MQQIKIEIHKFKVDQCAEILTISLSTFSKRGQPGLTFIVVAFMHLVFPFDISISFTCLFICFTVILQLLLLFVCLCVVFCFLVDVFSAFTCF